MNPCFQCVDRIAGCHDGCLKYQSWKKANEAYKENIRRQKKLDYIANKEKFYTGKKY